MLLDAQTNNYKSGFIALIGRPNSGKSTLLNCILGQKVAITSDKPQTTRNSIRGIYTGAEYQVIFIDTPGVQKPRYKLEQEMMSAVRNALQAVDGVIYLVDVSCDFGGGEQYILKELGRQQAPVFLALNKIDLLPKDKLLPLIDFYRGKYDFAEIIPISAATGEN
ncbi:MAG: GTPase Era, partial [Clostridiales bacterium]|nr:GTPase Era [Clostridiales bacterium]